MELCKPLGEPFFFLLHFWMLIVTSVSSATDGRWCFGCTDVSNPAECGHVRKCSADQQCFAERYDTSMGFPKYNSGCENEKVCQRYNKREYYAHQVGDITECKSCCNNTDGCNGELCHSAHLDRSGIICFNCKGVSSPDMCQSVTMCSNVETCAWTRVISIAENKHVYEMGCLHVQACNMTHHRHCCSDSFCNSWKDFDCAKGGQVPRSKMCDGVPDCKDGSDEKRCVGVKIVG